MLAIALKFWLEGAKHGRIPPFLMPQSHRVLLNMAAGSIKQMVFDSSFRLKFSTQVFDSSFRLKFSTQHGCWEQNHEEGASC